MGFDIFIAFMWMEIEIFVVYEEHISAYGHTALDIVDLWIDWIAKDHDIAPFWSRA